MTMGGAHLGTHLLSKLVELLLPNDSGVAKPSPVWLYPSAWQLFRLQILSSQQSSGALAGGVTSRQRSRYGLKAKGAPDV